MAFEDREKIYHPSFGMLSIHRSNGHSGFLFGSNAEPDNYITLELSTAHLERELSNDWYHTDDKVLRLKMSPVQFAELLTTVDSNGVPCTIEMFDGKKIEQCTTVEDKKTATHRQFRERMKSFAVEIEEKYKSAQAIINKKTLSKKDQEELKWFYERMVQEMKSNIPFFLEVFQEGMDKIVLDAKAEIHASMTHAIVAAGVKTLGLDFNNEAKLLEDKE